MEGRRLFPEVARWLWNAGTRWLIMKKILLMPLTTTTSRNPPSCQLISASPVVGPKALFAKVCFQMPPRKLPPVPMIVAVVVDVVVVVLVLGCCTLAEMLHRCRLMLERR